MAKKICLDAGHYGKYNKSPVVPEYYESDMNWKLHLYLKSELEGYGFEVITTRAEQAKDLGLHERGYKSKGCDLFLSLHSNACGTESVDRVVVIANLDDKKYDFDDISREIGDKLGKVIKDTMGVNEYRVITKKSDNDRDKNGEHDDEWYGVLNGAKAARTPSMILEHSFHTNTKATKWLLVDDNLKKLAKNEAKYIAEYFGQVKVESKAKISVSMTEKEIWDALMKEFNNAYGVAGLLGNIKAESNLKSNNLQQTYEKKLGFTDDTYTAAVDNGTYNNFVRDSAGYGLAQWTYWSRKENLLNYANSVGHSIGSCKMQVDFLIKELKGYKTVYETLKYAKSVREASDVVLTQYERPADQSEAVQVKRANFGTEFFNKYVVQEPAKPDVEEKYYRVRTSWDKPASQIGAYTIYENAVRACKEGYSIYDWNGKEVYSNKKKELKEGDVIQLKPGTTYWNGKSIPSWVLKKTLYFRGRNNNGVIFSILKTGAITGVVKEENVIY